MAAHNALQAWANVANLHFTEVAETSTNVGDFRFGFSSAVDDAGAWGWSRYPNNFWASAADVWVNTSYASDSNWTMGSYDYEALMHEIGHGLGLKHPGNYNGDTAGAPPYLSSDLDNRVYTIMSYNDPARFYYWDDIKKTSVAVNPETPMVYDIQAMQYLYGANTSYHTGNDVYTFDPNDPFYKTIWDAGGTDTIDISNFSLDSTIDLTPGSYSDIGYATPAGDTTNFYKYDGTNALGIAFGATIENAIGGQGDDTLYGNDASNILDGGNGNDILRGGAGDDALNGGDGNDFFYVNAGSDTLDGGTGTDKVLLTYGRSAYAVSKAGNSAWHLQGNTSHPSPDFQDTLSNIEKLQFADFTVNLTVQAETASISASQVLRLEELYVAFFNRVPDADGLAYWIGQLKAGQSVNQIAEAFYSAGVQYSSLTGFSSSMTNGDFVDVVYRNVLGRADGADAEGLAYWSGKLADGSASHGSLVSTILDSAHTFKGNATWGWVADLLDNKAIVADKFAVDWGLNYNTSEESISNGMAIAHAVTSSSTDAAIALILKNSVRARQCPVESGRLWFWSDIEESPNG